MIRVPLFIALTTISLMACTGDQDKKETEPMAPAAETTDTVRNQEDAANTAGKRSFTTRGGKVVDIAEAHPMGMSMSDITITGHGFTDSLIEIKDENPVSNVLEGDLDKDGFSEYYIITTAAGSGSYGNIIGIASVKDNSLVRISVADFKDPKDYMGHDSFRIEGDKIIRSYPVYKDKDANASPSGETGEIVYKLIQKAPGKYSLDPVK